MKKIQLALLMMITNLANAQSTMPSTTKEDVQDVYFGKTINDPYRWLENDNAENTKKWVEEQNAYTEGILNNIPFRATVNQQLTDLWNYAKTNPNLILTPHMGGYGKLSIEKTRRFITEKFINFLNS